MRWGVSNTAAKHTGVDDTLFDDYFPYPYEWYYDDDSRSHPLFYWSFDYGPAHIVMIDVYDDYNKGSDQYKWLEYDLANTTKRWKFLLFHTPGYSAGAEHPNSPEIQSEIEPLLKEYGVDMTFSGDNHMYARADLYYGTQHITTGGGGANLYPPQSGDDYPYIVDENASRSYHFCMVKIEGDHLEFTVKDEEGRVLDRYSKYRSALTTYEAEETLTASSGLVKVGLTGGSQYRSAGVTSTDLTGFTGAGFVRLDDVDKITWTVDIEKEADCNLIFRYAWVDEPSDKTFEVQIGVDGQVDQIQLDLPGSDHWSDVSTLSHLTSGAHEIHLAPIDNTSEAPYLDHLRIQCSDHDAAVGETQSLQRPTPGLPKTIRSY